jgi:predicted DNA binding CopG/RHH family protein
MVKKDYNLDVEERKILDSFNRGEWISKEENLEKYKEAAKQTFKKTHSINFHMSEKDFRSMQMKAIEEGMSYQTLLSSVVHKYLTGQMKMA